MLKMAIQSCLALGMDPKASALGIHVQGFDGVLQGCPIFGEDVGRSPGLKGVDLALGTDQGQEVAIVFTCNLARAREQMSDRTEWKAKKQRDPGS